MNLKEKMKGYVLEEVSVWNEDGNRQKFLPQNEYLNLCEATSIAEEYAIEMCKKQKEIDKAITHIIASAAYERDFHTYDEVERLYSLSPLAQELTNEQANKETLG